MALGKREFSCNIVEGRGLKITQVPATWIVVVISVFQVDDRRLTRSLCEE